MDTKELSKDVRIIFEIYQKMYSEATPSKDFYKMYESGETKRDRFFMDYSLSEERQEEITEEILKKHKVPKWRRKYFRQEVCLGCSPSSRSSQK